MGDIIVIRKDGLISYHDLESFRPDLMVDEYPPVFLFFPYANVDSATTRAIERLGLTKQIRKFDEFQFTFFHDGSTRIVLEKGSKGSDALYFAKNNQFGFWGQLMLPSMCSKSCAETSCNYHNLTVETSINLLGEVTICHCFVDDEKYIGEATLKGKQLTFPTHYAHKGRSRKGAVNLLLMDPPIGNRDDLYDHIYTKICHRDGSILNRDYVE